MPTRSIIAPSKSLPSEPGFMYHATSRDNVRAIKADGHLAVFKPDFGTDQDTWPDGSTDKRSYWMQDASSVWQFVPDSIARGVVLRCAKTDAPFKRESTGDWFCAKPIAVDKLSFLTSDGWIPLADLDESIDERANDPAFNQTLRDGWKHFIAFVRANPPTQRNPDEAVWEFKDYTPPAYGKPVKVIVRSGDLSGTGEHRRTKQPVIVFGFQHSDEKLLELFPKHYADWMNSKESTFRHEFSHLLRKQQNVKIGASSAKYNQGDVSGYYNSPSELDAYFQEYTTNVEDLLHVIKDAGVSVDRRKEAVEHLLGKTAAGFITKADRDSSGFGDFMRSLTPDNRRRLVKRLTQYRENALKAHANESVDEAAKVGDTIIRYTHRNGVGLLNNAGLNRDKLSDDEESELVDVMDFGLQQPGAGVKGTFYFTEEGEKKHARLLQLLRKASKTGVVRTVSTLKKKPSWESDDGQIAVDETIDESSAKVVDASETDDGCVIELQADSPNSRRWVMRALGDIAATNAHFKDVRATTGLRLTVTVTGFPLATAKSLVLNGLRKRLHDKPEESIDEAKLDTSTLIQKAAGVTESDGDNLSLGESKTETIQQNGRDVRVLISPTKLEFDAFYGKTKYRGVRMLVADDGKGDVFVWSAENAIHRDAAESLGLFDTISLVVNDDDGFGDVVATATASETDSEAYLSGLLRNPKFMRLRLKPHPHDKRLSAVLGRDSALSEDNLSLDESNEVHRGYKIVGYDGKRYFSLYDTKISMDIRKGSTTSYGGAGLFLGTTREFAVNYYSGGTNFQDALLTYDYKASDLIKGDPKSHDGEVQVRKAKLVAIELLPVDGPEIDEAQFSPDTIWYHGGPQRITRFSYDNVGKGHDAEGPGFYFTRLGSYAKGYAYPNGYLHKARLKLRKVIPLKGRIPRNELAKLAKQASNFDEALTNWDENPKVAYDAAMSNCFNADGPYDAFINILTTFYRHREAEFLKNVVALGYDAVFPDASKYAGTQHVVVFNPAAIEFVSVEPYAEAQVDEANESKNMSNHLDEGDKRHPADRPQDEAAYKKQLKVDKSRLPKGTEVAIHDYAGTRDLPELSFNNPRPPGKQVSVTLPDREAAWHKAKSPEEKRTLVAEFESAKKYLESLGFTTWGSASRKWSGAAWHSLKFGPVPKLNESSIDEGVFDPHILKAVFLAGGGGSGKSYFGRQLFGGTGLKVVNSDEQLEYLVKKAGLSLKTDLTSDTVQKPGGIRDRAKELTGMKQANYIDGRLGLIIDGTGAKANKIIATKAKLEELGYDCAMVLINVPLERSLENNRKRARVVPEEVIKEDWEAVQKAIPTYKAAFGTMFREIAPTKMYTPEEARTQLAPQLNKIALKLIGGPVRNPIGKAWIETQVGDDMKSRKLVSRSLGESDKLSFHDTPCYTLDEGDADAPANDKAVNALVDFIVGTEQYVMAVARPVALYKARGDYDAKKAPLLARYTVEGAAKAYHAKHGAKGEPWHATFNPKTRAAIAEKLIAQATKDAASRKYDDVLPKKYQKGFDGYGKDKKTDESATPMIITADGVKRSAGKDASQNRDGSISVLTKPGKRGMYTSEVTIRGVKSTHTGTAEELAKTLSRVLTQASNTDEDVDEAGKTTTAKIDGKTYKIPEMWIAGYIRSNPGATALDAVKSWHRQAQAEAKYDKGDVDEAKAIKVGSRVTLPPYVGRGMNYGKIVDAEVIHVTPKFVTVKKKNDPDSVSMFGEYSTVKIPRSALDESDVDEAKVDYAFAKRVVDAANANAKSLKMKVGEYIKSLPTDEQEEYEQAMTAVYGQALRKASRKHGMLPKTNESDVDESTTEFLYDPTISQFTQLLLNSKSGAVRGLLDRKKGKTYWWDAYHATHADGASRTGVEWNTSLNPHIAIYIDRDAETGKFVYPRPKRFPVLTTPAVKKYIDKVDQLNGQSNESWNGVIVPDADLGDVDEAANLSGANVTPRVKGYLGKGQLVHIGETPYFSVFSLLAGAPTKEIMSLAEYKKSGVPDETIDDFDLLYFCKRVSDSLQKAGVPKHKLPVTFIPDKHFHHKGASGVIFAPGSSVATIELPAVPSSIAETKYAAYKGPRSPHSLAHEYGHHVYALSSTTLVADTMYKAAKQNWAAACEAKNAMNNGVCKSNAMEYFCEMFGYYVMFGEKRVSKDAGEAMLAIAKSQKPSSVPVTAADPPADVIEPAYPTADQVLTVKDAVTLLAEKGLVGKDGVADAGGKYAYIAKAVGAQSKEFRDKVRAVLKKIGAVAKGSFSGGGSPSIYLLKDGSLYINHPDGVASLNESTTVDESGELEEPDDEVDEVSPPGFSGTTRAMVNKHGMEPRKAFALAWSMFKKGAKPHKKPDANPKGIKRYLKPETYAKRRAAQT